MATLTITGTAADDTVVITASGTDSGSYSINGGPAVAFSGVTQVVVTGEDGNDTLTIVNPEGSLFAPTNGISYDGGGDPADALEVLGGAANDLTYTAGATPDAGTLTYAGEAGTQTIDFAGIAPITDTVAAATLTIFGTAESDAIAVTDGGLVNGFQTTEVSAPGFESIRFANKTTVTINGNGGADTLTFNNPTVAAGLNTFNVTNVGAVTQTGAVNYTNLSLDVTGAVTLTGNNDVTSLAAAVTGFGAGFSFNDVDDIALTSVGGVNGISTNNSAIAITTANGPIIVTNTAAAADVNAGASTASLTAGSLGAADFFIQLQPSANMTGFGGVQLRADHIDLTTGSTVNAGAATATLSGFNAGTLIDLGAADAANTLGLTDSELDGIAAGILRIGDAGSGRISVTDAITPAGTSQLELVTGADIQDNHVGTDVAVVRLAMTAQTGISTTASVLGTAVGQIEAQTDTGGLRIDNSSAVTVGGVTDGLTGLRVLTSGDLTLSATGTITLADPYVGLAVVTGGNSSGSVTLAASGAAADVTIAGANHAVRTTHGNISVTAGHDILLGTPGNDNSIETFVSGNINLSAGGNIVIEGYTLVAAGFASVVPGGSVTATAGGDIVVQGDDAKIFTSGAGDITLTTGVNHTLVLGPDSGGGLVSVYGDVAINTDRVMIANTNGISAASATIQPVSTAWAVDLGSATDAAASTLELSDAELDRIFTGSLRIGSISNTGNMTISSQISPNNIGTLALSTGGGIVDGTAGEQTDITVANLALQAASGIGSSDPLDVAVSNLAFNNSGFSNVNINNAAGLTLAAVDGLASSSNVGGAAQVSTRGPLTAATNVTASGVLDLFALDTAAPGDNLTVLGGVTVQSTGDTVRLAGGDDVVVQAGATVQSAGTLIANVDADNAEGGFGGTANLNGTFVAPDTRIIGNFDNDTLNGTPLVDSLEGNFGADTMRGGAGNDTYVVDNAGDAAIENAGEGTDTVRAFVHYTLPANVENLTLQAFAGDLQGYGNVLANTITGNEGSNVLDGGANADVMVGGIGNDAYVVDNAGDQAIENANEGNDTVFASITYALTANFDNLVLQGGADLQGYGNALVNALYGNSGSNVLDGGGSADVMVGGIGNDAYVVDNAGDQAIENANEGNDTVFASITYALTANFDNLVLQGGADLQGYGNALVNALYGNSGSNVLDGGGSADVMVGGIGNDAYVVDNAGDQAIENANEGNDTVFASITYALTANFDNLVLQGGADLQGYGNALVNALYGNSGSNVFDGGGGADVMVGGIGNDAYVVDNAGDQAIENANEGNDTVFASITYALTANFDNLVLQGGADLQGYGNALVNALYGNSGNNILNGNGGGDVMLGGIGNDAYLVDDGFDQVIENAGEGNDTIFASAHFILPANVDNLVQQGSIDLGGTGNALVNGIFGNSGNNTLDGQGSADVLTGNAGNDTFVFHAGQANGDTVVDFAGNGALAGDSLQFVGFGTTAQGATFTQIGASNQWQIHSGLDAHNEIISFSNGAAIHVSDVVFA